MANVMDALGDYSSQYWEVFVEYFCVVFEKMNQIIGWQLSVVVTVIAVSASLWYCWRRKSLALKPLEIISAQLGAQVSWPRGSEGSRSRFRKRDKVMFYGRRMLRKVKSLSNEAYGGQGRKRRAVVRFAKRLLQLQGENAPTMLKVLEPPAIFLEEKIDLKSGVPADALYMLENIRIFGHFDKPVFLKLCKYTEVLTLDTGEWLFRVGDVDESVFIVQSGQINVLVNNPDGSTMVLKTIKKGESVTSLLSFIDVWSGTPSQYKTVQARAIEPTSVIKLPMTAFQEIFAESPDILVRVIQVIMLRLERVTFTALRHYLGLHAELAYQSPSSSAGGGGGGGGGGGAGGSQRKKGKQSPGHQRSNSNYMDLANIMTQSTHSNPSPAVGSEGNRPDLTADLQQSQAPPPPLPPQVNPEHRKSSVTFDFASTEENHALYKTLAVEGFVKELGLCEEDKVLLAEHVIVKECTPGLTLVTEGEVEEVSLFYVLNGNLVVQQTVTSHMGGFSGLEKQEAHIMTVHPGELEGGLAVITGEASLYTIRAKHFARVAILERQVVYQIMRERPKIVLDIANSVVKKLSPLVRQCDFALDWVFLESGRAVYRQEEASDSTYIVLSGRLRSVTTHENGKKEILGEFGKGDLVGIVEMITDTVRANTAMAVRDSELAKLPQGLFNAIKLRHPAIVTQLFGLLSHRMLGVAGAGAGPATQHTGLGRTQLDSNYSTQKYTTVAIVAVNEDVPLTAFTYELYHSLSAVGPTLRLTSDVVRKTLGPTIMDTSHEYRLTSWLAQQEDRHKICLYQCDNNLTQWTQRCWRQADCIIIVGVNDHGPSVGNIEREIDRLMLRTQKELVILHKESSLTRPQNTVQWLNMRSWVTKHHHLVCPKRMFTRKSQYRVNDLYSKVLMSEPNIHSDFSRLARWLTGNSVGLVLGGGGARGAAHVGMLKAIQEAGIPIDMVGGVSIGAFMGALFCAEKNITTVTQKAREWCKKMTNWGRQLMDLTYPITSMFSGKDFNKTIRDTFGDVYIEDLWIPYFTLTTDITASCARIHTHGSLWRFVRASMSLSGYMPPLCDPTDAHLLLDGGYVNNLPGCLWRYCRASMSIAGLYPPICDYNDGHLLLDGCYTNNVPANVMRSLGAAHIIAVDVGSQDETNLTAYGDYLSGWWLLWKRFNPFSSPVRVPDLPDIQSRLAYVSCVRQLEEVKNSDYCEYVRPPIDQYKTLAFGSFDIIKEVGYKHGKDYFEKMATSGRISRFNNWAPCDTSHKSPPHTLNDYTFTDLAQIVCRIPETYPDNRYSSSDDEYFDGYISEPSTLHMKPKNMFRMKRTGGSLSLSENEMDSDDLEMPVPFNLSEKTRERLNSASRSNKTKEELLNAVANSKSNSPIRTGGAAAVVAAAVVAAAVVAAAATTTEGSKGGKEEEEEKRDETKEKKSVSPSKSSSTEDYVEIVD